MSEAEFDDVCKSCGESGAKYCRKNANGTMSGPWHRFCIPIDTGTLMVYSPILKAAEGCTWRMETLTPQKMHSMFVQAHWAVRNLAKALKVVGCPIGLEPIPRLMECTNELFGEISKRDEQINYLKIELAKAKSVRGNHEPSSANDKAGPCSDRPVGPPKTEAQKEEPG